MELVELDRKLIPWYMLLNLATHIIERRIYIPEDMGTYLFNAEMVLEGRITAGFLRKINKLPMVIRRGHMRASITVKDHGRLVDVDELVIKMSSILDETRSLDLSGEFRLKVVFPNNSTFTDIVTVDGEVRVYPETVRDIEATRLAWGIRTLEEILYASRKVNSEADEELIDEVLTRIVNVHGVHRGYAYVVEEKLSSMSPLVAALFIKHVKLSVLAKGLGSLY